MLDPSVTNESDPTSYDPEWDMYNPANGYVPYPAESRYDRAWLAQYRQRQVARNKRLDAIAHEWIDEQNYFRGQLRDPGYNSLPDATRGLITRHARLSRYMVIYRTLANPNYLDLTLDPSNRPTGSIFSPADPVLGNYGPGGLARLMTPGAWLSTWSGLSSQADLPDTITHVAIPTLIVFADGDCDIFPSEQRELMEKSGAADKTLKELPWADHYLNPVGKTGREMKDPRERLIDMIVPWIQSASASRSGGLGQRGRHRFEDALGPLQAAEYAPLAVDVERHVFGLAANAREPPACARGLMVPLDFCRVVAVDIAQKLFGAFVPERVIERVRARSP